MPIKGIDAVQLANVTDSVIADTDLRSLVVDRLLQLDELEGELKRRSADEIREAVEREFDAFHETLRQLIDEHALEVFVVPEAEEDRRREMLIPALRVKPGCFIPLGKAAAAALGAFKLDPLAAAAVAIYVVTRGKEELDGIELEVFEAAHKLGAVVTVVNYDALNTPAEREAAFGRLRPSTDQIVKKLGESRREAILRALLALQGRGIMAEDGTGGWGIRI